ncbi:MAG: hypothetical protein P8N68_08580 [Paracoccaceae bacterium]|nr:hypothetical protein [Paracoccaceae bacterium]
MTKKDQGKNGTKRQQLPFIFCKTVSARTKDLSFGGMIATKRSDHVSINDPSLLAWYLWMRPCGKASKDSFRNSLFLRHF